MKSNTQCMAEKFQQIFLLLKFVMTSIKQIEFETLFNFDIKWSQTLKGTIEITVIYQIVIK